MKLHRFYSGNLRDKYGAIELRQHVWVNDSAILNQWLRVLRFKVGDELVLFNGEGEDRLYKITKIEPTSVGLDQVTELAAVHPPRDVYLFFSLLKKDKNEWVLQKATELGVRNFVPILADRSEKTGFDMDRALKIVIEASEQCGRSDIPHIREPLSLPEALGEYASKVPLYFCELNESPQAMPTDDPVGVLIGPEGGWTDAEFALFKEHKLAQIHLGNLTLRAETAAVTAASKLL